MLKIQTNATFPQAFHSQTLPFIDTRTGTFRMDLGMIFDQPGTEPPPHPTPVVETPLPSLRLLCVDKGSGPLGTEPSVPICK